MHVHAPCGGHQRQDGARLRGGVAWLTVWRGSARRLFAGSSRARCRAASRWTPSQACATRAGGKSTMAMPVSWCGPGGCGVRPTPCEEGDALQSPLEAGLAHAGSAWCQNARTHLPLRSRAHPPFMSSRHTMHPSGPTAPLPARMKGCQVDTRLHTQPCLATLCALASAPHSVAVASGLCDLRCALRCTVIRSRPPLLEHARTTRRARRHARTQHTQPRGLHPN